MDKLNISRTDDITIVHPQNHKHTLVWIHGLNQSHEKHLKYIVDSLGAHINEVKIICPRAPIRYVTSSKADQSSWFDIKFRSEKSFIVPFDEAFSSAEVHESFEKILKPIIVEESQIAKSKGGKLIVCGFSQGCGMSLHSLYSLPNLVDAAIGISGYLFPFTKFDPNLKNEVFIIYGLADNLRPWEYTKITYEGKITNQKIILIEGMRHKFDQNTKIAFTYRLAEILAHHPKL